VKIIIEVYDPCNCNTLRDKFLADRQAAGFKDLTVGSVVECDCGTRWVLNEFEGKRMWEILVEAK
jgi:hypothetical protein